MVVDRERKELSWEPIETVSRYCAPACGRGCTVKEHDMTEAKAEVLARTLGPDWTPRVWENLGWHYKVESPCGRLSVHPSTDTSFLAFLNEPSKIGGRWSAHGDTPQEAMALAVKEAKKEYDQIGAILKGL